MDEAQTIGGRVYYPHGLQLLRHGSRFQMNLRSMHLMDTTIGLLEYASPVRIRTDALGDAYQINFALHGRLKMTYGEQEIITSPSVASIHGPEEETGVEGWAQPARMFGLKIPATLLQQELEVMLDRSVTQPVTFAGWLELDSKQGQEWRRAVGLVEQALRPQVSMLSSPQIAEAAVQAVIRGLLFVAPNNYTAELTGNVPAIGPTFMRRAVEYIDNNAHRPLTVGDIAKAVHVSVRSLQMGFKKHLGSSPMATVHSTRMQRVREELLRAPNTATVSEIAALWGFSQAGRFAVQYAQIFGESPSDTLKKSAIY